MKKLVSLAVGSCVFAGALLAAGGSPDTQKDKQKADTKKVRKEKGKKSSGGTTTPPPK